MRRFLLLIIVLPGFTGCEQLKSLTAGKETNPVFKDPPPRVAQVDRRPRENSRRLQDTSFAEEQGVRPVGRTTGGLGDPALDLSGSQIIATIDNETILASEVLERYAPLMEKARRDPQATPEILRTIRERVIRRDLPGHIRRKLLVNAFKKSLPEKNLKALDEHINSVFQKRVEDIKKEMKVDTRYEVEQQLAKAGTSLAAQRDVFANQQMAAYFFDAKKQSKKVFGRPESMKYYTEHLADYKQQARVRWQEIEVRFAKNGGKRGAADKIARATAALNRGGDFGAVAKEYSDASTASKGGQEEWIQYGSLADKDLERVLFEIPVGQLSRVLESDSAYRLIKVNGRDPVRFTPFGDVHDDIKKKLEEQAKEANAKKVIDDLHAKAVIWTIFDDQKMPEEPAPTRTAGNPFGGR